jgi:hypothetical protein
VKLSDWLIFLDSRINSYIPEFEDTPDSLARRSMYYTYVHEHEKQCKLHGISPYQPINKPLCQSLNTP